MAKSNGSLGVFWLFFSIQLVNMIRFPWSKKQNILMFLKVVLTLISYNPFVLSICFKQTLNYNSIKPSKV